MNCKNEKYYLTCLTEEDIKNGKNFLFWEEVEYNRNVFGYNPNLGRYWYNIEDMKYDIDFSDPLMNELNCALFENDKFSKFINITI